MCIIYLYNVFIYFGALNYTWNEPPPPHVSESIKGSWMCATVSEVETWPGSKSVFKLVLIIVSRCDSTE